MDLRKVKTERAIKEAFFRLRSKKTLEQLTVKELCQVAQINKSTFYCYYADLYALSDAVERETVAGILRSISPNQDYSLQNPEAFAREICTACISHLALTQTIFSQMDGSRLALRLEECIRDLIFEKYPQFREDPHKCILLSFCIQGAHHACLNNPDVPPEVLVSEIEKIVKTLRPLYE